jgi:hypothetical protein
LPFVVEVADAAVVAAIVDDETIAGVVLGADDGERVTGVVDVELLLHEATSKAAVISTPTRAAERTLFMAHPVVRVFVKHQKK